MTKTNLELRILDIQHIPTAWHFQNEKFYLQPLACSRLLQRPELPPRISGPCVAMVATLILEARYHLIELWIA